MGCRIPDLSLLGNGPIKGESDKRSRGKLRSSCDRTPGGDDMTYKRVTEADRRLIQRLVGSAGYSMA